MRTIWVPLGTFALAVGLSFVAGPSTRLLARPPGEASGGKCSCQLKVLQVKGKAEGSLFEIGENKTPSINKLKVRVDATICQEKTAAAPAANVQTDAIVEFLADLLVIRKGQLDGETVNLRTIIKPQKVDPLTCPGKNYPYTWEGDQDSLFLAAVEKAQQILKLKKRTENDELVDVILQLHGAGHDIDFIVSSETRCDGEFMINSCEVKVPVRKKKGILEIQGEKTKTCVNFVCRFGTP